MRHYGCHECQGYVVQWSNYFRKNLDPSKVNLVAMGMGTIQQAAKFKKYFNFPGEFYVDYDLLSYRTLKLQGNSACSLNLCCGGILNDFYLCCCRGIICMPKFNNSQQGGLFVLTPQNRCIFKYLEKDPTDHIAPEKVHEIIKKYEQGESVDYSLTG